MHILSRRTCLIAVCVLLVMAIIARPSFASPRIETDKEVSIEINYMKDGSLIPEAEFSLYKIAEVSPYVEFTVLDDFADYGVAVEGLDSTGWRDLAYTLEGYVERDNRVALDKGATDSTGRLVFADEKMTPGLYLIVGEKCTRNNRIYTPEPFIVCAPDRSEMDRWVYDINVQPKASVEIIPNTNIDLKVLKVWKNKSSAKRPYSIEVQLIKDGRVYDTVKLNKKNNWNHTWRDLNSKSDWKAVEKKVPAGYTVTSVREKNTFVITNTGKSCKDGGRLPQTGVLWWPCLALAVLGVISLCIGIILRRHCRDEKKAS